MTLTTAHRATTEEAQDAVAVLLSHLGYDPQSDALVGTPARVVRSMTELTQGEGQDVADHLGRVFAQPSDGIDHDELIACTGISFTAVCEHHLLPFSGVATVAYVPSPGAPVVGLSKLARVVDVFARRLTMQERITHQVTQAMDFYLDTVGVAAVLTSSHSCLGLRGARKPGATMVTSSLLGVFRSDSATRAELFALHHT